MSANEWFFSYLQHSLSLTRHSLLLFGTIRNAFVPFGVHLYDGSYLCFVFCSLLSLHLAVATRGAAKPQSNVASKFKLINFSLADREYFATPSTTALKKQSAWNRLRHGQKMKIIQVAHQSRWPLGFVLDTMRARLLVFFFNFQLELSNLRRYE